MTKRKAPVRRSREARDLRDAGYHQRVVPNKKRDQAPNPDDQLFDETEHANWRRDLENFHK